MANENNEVATLATGCFWCTEAIYTRLKGVSKVTSGYTGGVGEEPSYEEVSTGSTGYAEAVQVEFDPGVISFAELLEVFWKVHDPTTLNRQGNDVGTQYRSGIFYHNAEQKKIAEESKREAEAAKLYPDPIVTEITEFKNFYPAEGYHQDFYENNPNQPYCKVIIDPKVKKLLFEFKAKVK